MWFDANAMHGNRLLDVVAVAERFGVQRETVIRWIHAGRLHATRLPSAGGRGRFRISEADLDLLLEPSRRREGGRP